MNRQIDSRNGLSLVQKSTWRRDRRAVEGDGQQPPSEMFSIAKTPTPMLGKRQAVAGRDASGLEVDARAAERGEEGLELVDERERAGESHLVDVRRRRWPWRRSWP